MLTILGTLGLGGVSVAGLLAAAWFVPVFRQYFLLGAAVVAVAAVVYAKGVSDENKRRDAIERGVITDVDNAVRDAVTTPRKDKFDDPSN